MARVLLTETAFQRLRVDLDGVECLTMDAAGAIRLNGRAILPDDAAPECAFISNDVFFSPIEAGFIDALTRSGVAKWVQSAGAGVDHPMFARLAERGIRLTKSDGQAVGMAEYVLWGVLNHFQGGNERAAQQAAHRWTKRRSREIDGTRWLVVGFGAVGEAVARRAKGFGAHVTGVRRQAGQSPFADAMATPDRLSDYLGDSDVVVLCAPQTPHTTGMVDAKFLAAMKPGSVLINVGRGSLIDDDALRVALDAGTPEHAVLDVFRVEPLPQDSWFWDHPRVTVTPHGSALSTGSEARTDRVFLDNLARYLAGDPLLNEVSAADLPAR